MKLTYKLSWLLITLITLAGRSVPASAQHKHAPAKNEFMAIMDTMMLQMDRAAKGKSTAIDFINQMVPHHQAATAMARYEITHGKNFEMIQLAKSILAEQAMEIAQLQLLLKQLQPEGPLPANFTAAMDKTMQSMMDAMPAAASLSDTDHAFASIMLPHHQSAVAMARVILAYPADQQVAAFARQMISNQQLEIDQMSAYLNKSNPSKSNPTKPSLSKPNLNPSNLSTSNGTDRVYTANQVSNTVSVINPATNQLLGEITLGKPYPNVLSPIYRGQSLVHGLRYSAANKMLAVVAIGSNSVSLLSTETNQLLKTIYVGRSPHEPTFSPDNKQIWTTIRGEAYISVIDVNLMKEIKRVNVADGPGMISFSPDGKIAYICSSFTAELDIVNTATYQVIKKIPVISPFSPNITTSPAGDWVAMTHKDVGKVTVINPKNLTVHKVISTGPITNHVAFSHVDGKLLMLVTVGGENKVRVFDVAADFKQIDSVQVGHLPHGLWPSANGKWMYVGLEYDDQVQAIDLHTMQALAPVKIGQSPQALVYADHAVTDAANTIGLTPLNDTAATQVIFMTGTEEKLTANGKIAVRPIGLTDLVEQIFSGLAPSSAYTLVLSKSATAPFSKDYQINAFTTDVKGKYMGQSTGLLKSTNTANAQEAYKQMVLIDNNSGKVVLAEKLLVRE